LERSRDVGLLATSVFYTRETADTTAFRYTQFLPHHKYLFIFQSLGVTATAAVTIVASAVATASVAAIAVVTVVAAAMAAVNVAAAAVVTMLRRWRQLQ
jgi:uracil phosphoribosyltransferase